MNTELVTAHSQPLDKVKLKQATEANRTSTTAMVALGLRERAHSSTNLSSFRQELLKMGEQINDKDFMNFFKSLEVAGAGSLVLGRRGGQTRFEWAYSLRQIAQIAIDDKHLELKQVLKEKPKAVPLKIISTDATPKIKTLTKKVKLSDGREATITVPSDITTDEKLAIFRSLIRES